MDGFDSSTSVIVIGATNRPDVLDQALLRPGRFDRRVAVQPPDRAGRAAILKVHARGVPLGHDVDLDRIAATTPGMVGADLANLVNEAALLAARRNHQVVAEADFADALERIVLGAERQMMMSPDDRRRTAYHEAGHAIVGMLTPGADPVRKVSIIPRGAGARRHLLRARQRPLQLPASPRCRRRSRSRWAAARPRRSSSARSAPAPSPTSSSSPSIARQMVGRWGMSSAIGPVAVPPARRARARSCPARAEISPETQPLIDAEVRRIVDDAHRRGHRRCCSDNRNKLDSLAAALLEHETLDEDAAYAAADVAHRNSADAPERSAVGAG